jgi:bifunctional non-homologous end joining protein LigD
MAVAAPKKRLAQSRAAKRPDPLKRYRAKRDFARTAEPRGAAARAAGGRFVIQKHDASRLHFDFRLEIDGVLKSWAVPKGIPAAPGERHLAVMVEDHPLDYGAFEGTIPQGQYGGGTVMLWDRGTFRVGGDDPAAALREGKLHLFLSGEKLRGEWALVRFKREEAQWLLFKVGDALKPDRRRWDRAVASGRTLKEITTALPMPAFLEPMKAKLTTLLPEGDGWLYELKFDGYRFLGGKAGEDTRLWSRTENNFTARFPNVAHALRELKARAALVDGELVVPDEEGRPRFQLIQNADDTTPVRAFLFDLVSLDGVDLRDQPLTERRARLAAILPARSGVLHLSTELAGTRESLLAEICERGLEGLIAKRRDSRYEAGRRSGAWVKVKCLLEQEFVIGGFTPPKGTRPHFGALLIGHYRGKKLIYAGKVGTGFDDATLAALHRRMSALRAAHSPFAALPTGPSRWGSTFTRAELARCTWVLPRLVAQVRFAEWTEDGVLRQPAFIALRDDKPARQVVRET